MSEYEELKRELSDDPYLERKLDESDIADDYVNPEKRDQIVPDWVLWLLMGLVAAFLVMFVLYV